MISNSNITHASITHLDIIPQIPQITIMGESLNISGSLTYDTVLNVWKAGLQAIQTIRSQNPIQINLAGLQQSDSSGLALWSSWMRAARQYKKKIQFVNIPPFMQDLIRVHGLESILPIQH